MNQQDQEQQLIVGSATDGFGENANQPCPVDLAQALRVQPSLEKWVKWVTICLEYMI